MQVHGPATVEAYLDELPEARRAAIGQVRDVINANLPAGYEEGVQYGLISWYIPLARYPDTYNGQPLAIASLGAQKGHMALYLMSVYGDPELDAWFRGAFARAGKKLDMGKSCVRFQSLDALPLDVIGEAIRRVPVEAFLAKYEEARAGAKGARGAKAKPAAEAKPAARAKPAAKAEAKPAAVKPARSRPRSGARPAASPASRTRRR